MTYFWDPPTPKLFWKRRPYIQLAAVQANTAKVLQQARLEMSLYFLLSNMLSKQVQNKDSQTKKIHIRKRKQILS